MIRFKKSFQRGAAALVLAAQVVAPLNAYALTYEMRNAIPNLRVDGPLETDAPVSTGALSFEVPAQTFGKVALGGSVTRVYVLQNKGDTALPLTFNAAPANINVSTTCATTMPAMSQCSVSLTFAPTEPVSVSGSFSVTSGSNVATLSYSGSGENYAGFDLSTSGLNFTPAPLGGTRALSFAVLNAGNQPLSTPAITVEGGGFSASHNCPSTLAVEGSCTVTVTFTPQTVGIASGTATVAFANAAAQTVALNAEGVAAILSMDKTTHDFGEVGVGMGASTTFVVTNNSASSIPLSYSTLNAPFSRAGTCGVALGAGNSCTVVVNYNPTAQGSYTAPLTVSTTDGQAQLSLSAAAAFVSLDPATLDFGYLGVNTSSTKTSVVTNISNLTLSTPALNVSGTGFSRTHNCPASLAPGASCTASVTFSPTAAQEYSGTLSVGFANATARNLALTGGGRVAVLEATPLQADFGNVNVSSNNTATYTLTNTGLGTANLSYSTVSAPITRGGTCGASLAVNASCTVVLTFAPTTVGTFTGSVTVSAPGTSVELAYTGKGVSFTPSTSSVNFGGVPTIETATQSVTLTNDSVTALNTPTITVAGTGFSGTHNCPASLGVGQSCEVQVTFAPTARTSYSGSITAKFANSGTQTISLAGEGLQAILGSNVTSQAFGTVNIGQSPSLSFTVNNTGTAAAVLTYTTVPAPFTRSGDCADTLAVGASCTLTITYTPTATVTSSSSVTLSAHGTSRTLSFSGTGNAFDLSTTSLAFPDRLSYDETDTKTVVVENKSNIDLVSPGISVNSTGYSATHNCPGTLSPGASCAVSVTFAPTAAASYSRTLTVNFSNASSKTVSLTGIGRQSVLTVSPTSQTFPTTNIGSTNTLTYTVSNTGNLAEPISISAPTAPFSISGGTCTQGLSLGVAATCTVQVRFSPTTLAHLNASNGSVTVSARRTSTTLSYSGTGEAFTITGYAFGTLGTGRSQTANVVVQNVSNLTLTTPSMTTSGSTMFTYSNGCTGSLAAGASCNISTTFLPTTEASHTGTVTMSYAGVTAKAVSVTGAGTRVVISPASWSFGSIAVGSSGSKVFTISNPSTTSLTTPTVSASGTGYSITSNGCTASLAALGTCSVTVRYAPTVNGAQAGTLNVDYSNSTARSASLSGTGLEAMVTANTYTVNFGTVALGSSSSVTVTLTNTGGASGSLSFSTLSAPFSRNGGTCGTTLAAGASCTYIVKYAPTSKIYSSSSFTATTAGNAALISVTGTGG